MPDAPPLLSNSHSHDPRRPRCMTCGYALVGIGPVGVCPECAREFNLRDPRTYIVGEPFMRWRYWAPGLLLAVGVGVFLQVTLSVMLGNWGYALWLGVPAAVGAALGFGARAKVMGWFALILMTALAVVATAAGLGLAGVFCAIVLSAIVLLPIAGGVAAGLVLRIVMKSTSWGQRSYLPLILITLLPIAWALIEGPPDPRSAIEVVTTERIIDAPARACWDGIVYYEQVTHEPPWILRVGLARPLNTLGVSKDVGDVKTCVYNKGHITKRITQSEPDRLLAFDVIEQEIGYERDVRLVRGAFRFEPIDADRTRVVLTTEYVPLLAPRPAWRIGEQFAIHTLHRYVTEGIARRAEGREDRASQSEEVR